MLSSLSPVFGEAPLTLLKPLFALKNRACRPISGVAVFRSTVDRWPSCLRIGCAAFDAAGADCLYIPIPPELEDIRAICASTHKPVNALAAGKFTGLSRAQFAEMGVARISLGSALARATHRTIFDAANLMFESGDFSGLAQSINGDTIDELLLGNRNSDAKD